MQNFTATLGTAGGVHLRPSFGQSALPSLGTAGVHSSVSLVTVGFY